MTAITPKASSALPEFAEGIQYFGEALPDFETYGATPAIESGKVAIADPTNPHAVYQTLLAADALRYLTLQITGSKASGHPGGFASQAEAYASLVMLGYKNIITEVGHHAPDFIAPCSSIAPWRIWVFPQYNNCAIASAKSMDF